MRKKFVWKTEQKVAKLQLKKRYNRPVKNGELEFKDKIIKDFIMNFFHGLPIQVLKEIVNFQETDFEDITAWENTKSINLLRELEQEDVLLFAAELKSN